MTSRCGFATLHFFIFSLPKRQDNDEVAELGGQPPAAEAEPDVRHPRVGRGREQRCCCCRRGGGGIRRRQRRRQRGGRRTETQGDETTR